MAEHLSMDEEETVYSVTIPVYNSQATLAELMERLTAVMDATGRPYEVILVDDASRDGSWREIKRLKKRYPAIRGFRMMSNVGQYKALLCALDHARGRYVITLDDDLQNPPEEIPKLIARIESDDEVECVIGAPRTKRHSLYRNMGTAFVSWIYRVIFNKPRDLTTSSFRIFTAGVRDALVQYRTRNPVLTPLLLRNARSIVNVEVEHDERRHGRSGYSLARLVKITLDNVLNFSTLPLKVVSLVGLAAASLSLLLTALYAFWYAQGKVSAPGFITLVLLITFFSGLILLSMGLIGEYLIRIIEEVNHSPRYIIRERT
ncbi:MAG TPA: glycosyltransferase [Deltaproteobacteria bacterium]|nr:glycosyltransferase [Deltaproteobacteria bacterium]